MNFKSRKELIEAVQEHFKLDRTGILTPLTKAAISNWQRSEGLDVTGELDQKTVESIFEDHASTDLNERVEWLSELKINKYYLPNGEYVKESTKKEFIVLHHTAGWDNPYDTVDWWGRDSRGRVGTHYVIGGINPRTRRDSYNGEIVQCIDDDYWAFHLGTGDRNFDKRAIGIELCNIGNLERRGSSYYTYLGNKVLPEFVEDIGYEFRGFRYFQRYSDKQLDSLRKLLIQLSDKHEIDLKSGIQQKMFNSTPQQAFEFDYEMARGRVKGLLTHANVRSKYKWDMSPQKKLIELIESL